MALEHPTKANYSGPVNAAVVHKRRLDGVNDSVIDWHVKVLGSPYFLYFCYVLDLIELPPVIAAHSIIVWIAYISQTVIQLVALPSLQAKANREGSHAEEQSKQQYENQLVTEHNLEKIMKHLDIE